MKITLGNYKEVGFTQVGGYSMGRVIPNKHFKWQQCGGVIDGKIMIFFTAKRRIGEQNPFKFILKKNSFPVNSEVHIQDYEFDTLEEMKEFIINTKWLSCKPD